MITISYAFCVNNRCLILLIRLIGLLGANNIWSESLSISTIYSTAINSANSPHHRYTPVQHYQGKTFFVCPANDDLRPLVTQVNDATVETITVALDNSLGSIYTAFPDGHQRFSMGIDPDGYLHVAGDMHGYPTNCQYIERYTGQTILYWKSNKPLDVTGGFTFSGGRDTEGRPYASSLPENCYGENSRFFNDKNNNLYYSCRVIAFSGGNLTGPTPNCAFGVYRYDHIKGIWKSLGGTCESAVPTATQFNTVLYWENTMAFEAYYDFVNFDNQNRLHFGLAGHAGKVGSLIYAVSEDQGKTWKKANGQLIPNLPIRSADGQSGQGDIVARPYVGDVSACADKNGTPLVNEYFWNGNAWVKGKSWGGLLGPDNMLTHEGGNYLNRGATVDQPMTSFKTGFDKVYSASILGLQTTGAIYGIGTPNVEDHQMNTVCIYKGVFGPAHNVANKGKAIASSGSAGHAFDSNRYTQWITTASAPGWVSYAFASGSSQQVCRYDLTSSSDFPQCDPKSWTLEGSNDGSHWVTLDARSNEIFGARNQIRCYPIKNKIAYSQYRLMILAVRGNPNNVIRIAEMTLMTVDSHLAPSAPNIFSNQSGESKVWLSWTQPDHAVTYNVKRAMNGIFTIIAEGVTDPGDFLDTTVSNGTAYTYVVSAVNSAGESANSNPVTVTPQLMAPRAPCLQAAEGHNQNVVVKWLPLWPAATSYTLYRSTKSGGPYKVVVSNLPGLSYTDINLANDTTYYYVVKASNAVSGNSVDSNEVNGRPFRYTKIMHRTPNCIDWMSLGTASSSYGSGEGAFDKPGKRKWIVPSPGWVQFRFNDETARAVTRYQLISVQEKGALDRDPKSWEFLASNDGVNWVILDTQTNQTIANGAPTNAYSIVNTTTYQYYRLNVTKNHGSYHTQLDELVFWEDGEVITRAPPSVAFPRGEVIEKSVLIIPVNSTLFASDTLQFVTTYRDENCEILAPQPKVTWSVSEGGTISNNGLFPSGQRYGLYTVSGFSSKGIVTTTVNVIPPKGLGTGITREYFTNVEGGKVSDLTKSDNYILDKPDSFTVIPDFFEGPSDLLDLYGARYRGYYIAPVTGDYTFWVAADNSAEIWLSTDSNPANKFKIAYNDQWIGKRYWSAGSQKSAPIQLVAGKRYYIEGLHKQASPTNNFAVGTTLPGGVEERPIPGHRIESYVIIPVAKDNLPPPLQKK